MTSYQQDVKAMMRQLRKVQRESLQANASKLKNQAIEAAQKGDAVKAQALANQAMEALRQASKIRLNKKRKDAGTTRSSTGRGI